MWVKTDSELLATIFYDCLEGIFKISTKSMVPRYAKLIAVIHYFFTQGCRILLFSCFYITHGMIKLNIYSVRIYLASCVLQPQ